MTLRNDFDEGAELSRFNHGRLNAGQFYEVERDRYGLMYSGPLEVGECVTVVPAAVLLEVQSILRQEISEPSADLLAAVVTAALAEINAALPGAEA